MTGITPEFRQQSLLDYHRRMRDEALAQHPAQRAEIEAYYQQKLREDGLSDTPDTPEPASPQPGRPGMAGGIARSALQGAALGWSDELRGLGAALVPGGDDYTTARDKERDYLSRFREDHPTAATLSEIGGGIASAAVPGALALRGAKAAEGAGAITKAYQARKGWSVAKAAAPYAYGYAAGTAEGDVGDQVLETFGQGTVGMAMAPVVGGVAGKAAKGARRVFPKLRTAEAEAGERVLMNVARDQQTPRSLRTAAQAAQAAGVDDVAMADLGKNLQAELDWVAQVPGQGQTQVHRFADDRDGNMRRMLRAAYQKLVGRGAESPAVQQDVIRGAQSAAGNAAFEPVFQRAPQLVDDPATAGALLDALQIPGVKSGAERLARAWKAPTVVATEAGEIPTWRFAHYVKMHLQTAAEQAAAKGDNALAAGLSQRAAALRDAMVGGLGDDYAKALEQFAGFSRQLDALALGRRFLQDAVDPTHLTQQIAAMDPAAQQAFRVGADAAVRGKLGKMALGAAESTAWWADDAVQQKLGLVMGPDDLAQFRTMMEVTRTKQATNKMIQGSRTFTRQARDEDASTSVFSAVRDMALHPAQTVKSVGGEITKALDRRQREKVAAKLPRWLTATGPDLMARIGDLDALQRALILEELARLSGGRAAGAMVGGR